MPESRADYKGDFDPALKLEDFEHSLLACYARDIMLANHIHDRSALVQVVMNYGMEAQTGVACDEWMGSSPIYNARNRELLNISGDDVPTAFKCFQLDIGAPHNYLKFHYQVDSPREGYFWTTSCGPYNHVRRMTNADPEIETQICHHMEDPTFDASDRLLSAGPCAEEAPCGRSGPVEEDGTEGEGGHRGQGVLQLRAVHRRL